MERPLSISWSAVDGDGQNPPEWNGALDATEPREVSFQVAKLAYMLPPGWTLRVEVER